MRLRRLVSAVAILDGLMLAAAGTLILATASERWERGARAQADIAVARAVAGYLALSIDTTEQGDFRPAPLLSGAGIVARASGREGGLQVVWRGVPLLPDSLELGRLDSRALAALEGRGTAQVRRLPVGAVGVTPLLTPGGSAVVGWVAAWDTTPRGATGGTPVPVWLAAGALVLAAVVSGVARGGSIARIAALGLGLLAIVGAAVGARFAQRSLDLGGHALAAASLEQVRVVVALAAHQTGAPVERLAPLAPDFGLRLIDGPVAVSGPSLGAVHIGLGGDSAIEIASPGAPDSLASARRRLAIGAALLAAGAALATWRIARRRPQYLSRHS